MPTKRNTFNPRRRLLCLGALGASVACPAFAQGTPVKLRFQLDWRFEAGTIPYVVALRKGYFAQEGLDVTLNVGAGAAATVTRLAAGNADMGTGDMNSLAEFAGNNAVVPAQAVLLMYERTPAAIFSLKKTGIRKPSDLKGRALAAPVNDGARKIFPLFAAANGLDAQKDVRWLSVEPAIRETMLAREQAEAISGYIASGLVSLQRIGVSPDDVAVMRYADFGVPLFGNAILASTAFAQQQPQAVSACLRAVMRAMKDIRADREGAVALLKQHDPLIDTRMELLRLGIVLDQEIGTPNVRRDGLGGIDLTRYQAGIDALAPVLGLKTVPRAGDLATDRFMPTLAERRVFAG
jgi:NitT/TauT family transport system substrate-binding protein